MNDIYSDRILIIDFGSQYTQLIARRVRELKVYCEIMPYDVDPGRFEGFVPTGIILSGGPQTVTDQSAPKVNEWVFTAGVPVLGICYGMQAMAMQLGGEVAHSLKREFGFARLRCRDSKLLAGIEDAVDSQGVCLLDVWMSHADRVEVLPPGFVAIASTDNAPLAGMADERRGLYGLQFHPEVTHTTQGVAILKRFIYDLCGCVGRWQSSNIIQVLLEQIRKQVAQDRVVLGLSGGVDSSVVAALLHRAIGDQLVCIFVDNGLLRLHEGQQVMETFSRHLGVKVIQVDAAQRFLARLSGQSDPEIKRKMIGNLFVEIFEEEANKLNEVRWLAQGTIYPDVVESAGAHQATVIKSHHNVGGLPQDMQLRLLEPLRELFKDEVRRIGIELGLPDTMVNRHPFPGPGLGVRILGEIKKSYVDTLRLADDIFMQELRASGWYERVSQAFAVFLPIQSVGVTGDQRHYGYVVVLRAVQSTDFMTAQWARLPDELLARLSTRIINEVPGISRVAYDISGKPPATIEWE